ncbi:hypothetical protein NKH37_23740 [Mesorhizobium sp. M1217]|uniref:hypothetical protein n=1 Tax=Mesorhizobium sp. M1217 TaxID=2957070 RepID=UPI003334B113
MPGFQKVGCHASTHAPESNETNIHKGLSFVGDRQIQFAPSWKSVLKRLRGAIDAASDSGPMAGIIPQALTILLDFFVATAVL